MDFSDRIGSAADLDHHPVGTRRHPELVLLAVLFDSADRA
jgi:hypothetical protein